MSDSAPTPPANEPSTGQLERFEVVLDPAHTARVSALDLDRLPDRDTVRLLVDAEQLDRLRASGLQVSVRRSVPVRPLDPALVATEDDVTQWLASRLGDVGGRSADPTTAPSDEER